MMTYQELDEWLIAQAKNSPVLMNKNSGVDAAEANNATANSLQNTFAQQGQAEQAQVLPFLNQEMLNPQGFGQQGVNELQTAGGQAVSGAVGNANQAANLRASRSGNASSTGAIIDAASRGGMQQQSNNALGINTANLQEKLAQQQAGEQGIASLSSGNIGESLQSLGLSNQAQQGITQAYTAGGGAMGAFGTVLGDLGGIGTGVGAAAKGITG